MSKNHKSFFFIFPEGLGPDKVTMRGRSFPLPKVPMSEFRKLTKIPIVIYYGDNIPKTGSDNPGQEQWRIFLNIAEQFRDVVTDKFRSGEAKSRPCPDGFICILS